MITVELVIGLSIGLLVMWLGLLLLLLLLVPQGVDLAEAKQFVPDVVRLVRDLAKDKSLGGGIEGASCCSWRTWRRRSISCPTSSLSLATSTT